ncbi:MAG: C-terminal binding protein [Nannocystaceae bacterium]
MNVAGTKVAILDFEPGKHFSVPDVEREILGDDVEIRIVRARDAHSVLEHILDAHAVIVWSRFELDAEVLQRLHNCRGIVCASVGYDHVDLACAATLGIPVCNVPDYGTEEVADHTLALLLALVRQIVSLDAAIHRGVWDWKQAGRVSRLRGRGLGVVGFGRIGSAVARRAQSFGLEVSFYDPFLPSGIEKSHAVTRHESLEDLLDVADIISLHTPLTPQTDGMISAEMLARLRPGALLLNTARGSLVDIDAVTQALVSGSLAGVGLDVLPNEPHVPAQLLQCKRAILTPHAAWCSEESFLENRRKAATKALRLLMHQSIRDVVNRGQLPSDPVVPR